MGWQGKGKRGPVHDKTLGAMLLGGGGGGQWSGKDKGMGWPTFAPPRIDPPLYCFKILILVHLK